MIHYILAIYNCTQLVEEERDGKRERDGKGRIGKREGEEEKDGKGREAQERTHERGTEGEYRCR